MRRSPHGFVQHFDDVGRFTKGLDRNPRHWRDLVSRVSRFDTRSGLGHVLHHSLPTLPISGSVLFHRVLGSVPIGAPGMPRISSMALVRIWTSLRIFGTRTNQVARIVQLSRKRPVGMRNRNYNMSGSPNRRARCHVRDPRASHRTALRPLPEVL